MDQKSIEILCKALETAPAPVDLYIDSVHPEDVQKWNDRYKIWYKQIRCKILDLFVKEPKHNIYYSIDRLVQEANALQVLMGQPDTQPTTEPAKEQKPNPSTGIVIGTIVKKRDQ